MLFRSFPVNVAGSLGRHITTTLGSGGPKVRAITTNGGGESLSAKTVLDEVVPAFEKLRQQGKTRFLGITAVGDTAALHQVIDARVFDSAQVSYNMLNPSAGSALPAGYPAQDYGKMFDHTQSAGVGVVGIRVLAGGALSGAAERHPIASPPPDPIGSAHSYDADMQRARRLSPLVQQGHAGSLPEAAVRFAISHPAMGTILVGMATPQQFEDALPLFKKVRCHPPHSVACQGCYTHSLASRGDRHERSSAESSYYPEEKARLIGLLVDS